MIRSSIFRPGLEDGFAEGVIESLLLYRENPLKPSNEGACDGTELLRMTAGACCFFALVQTGMKREWSK